MMKNLKILLIVFTITGISCTVECQARKTVHGNKKVVTSEREAASFNNLRVSTGINVFLKQGNDESISVEADENLHEYILTEIKNGVLSVYSEVNIRDAEKMSVYVTMKEITSLSTSSAGDITGETPLKSDRVELSASSAGNIRIEIYAKKIDANISSSGDISLKGETDMLEADLSSAGDLNAYGLQAREAEVSVSSAGDANIYVTEKITGRASSAGDINYKGDPEYIDAHTSSAGGIHRR